jgi:hypothetical protein
MRRWDDGRRITVKEFMANSDQNDFAQRAFRQFLDLYVTPEVKRRQEAGSLPQPLPLDAFQIVWYPDGRPHQVRVNRGEVKARLRVKLKEDVRKQEGEEVLLGDVDQIEGIELTDHDDADCGHATFFRFGEQWHGQFDAIYNKGLAKQHLVAGDEFYVTAKHAFEKRHWLAFADNLFSASELYAKAALLLLAEFGLRKKANHDGIRTRFNYHSHLGNVDANHSRVLNRLSALRNDARYLKGQPQITEPDAAEMLSLVKEMKAYAQRFLPAV